MPPSYSNIALMKAWLEVEAGDRAGGEEGGRAVVDLFAAQGGFDEYNSPTYYGVDLYALALWRSRSSSPRLRDWGASLESALWRDVARWYHAGLANLCGPWSRSYGMDMTDYLALLGLWVVEAAAPEHPPVPELGPSIDHAHDLSLAPCVPFLGTGAPQDAAEHLREFRGERHVEQQMQGGRTATGWLAQGVMAGGMTGSAFPARGQHHPATAHWALPDRRVGWLRVVHGGVVEARAQAGVLEVECQGGRDITLVVRAPNVTAEPERGSWDLPGLRVGLGGDTRVVGVEPGDSVNKVRVAGRRLRLELAPVPQS